MVQKNRTLRRSVALPAPLVEEAMRLAPRELRDNFNRLVVTSLEEYVKHRRADAFEKAMAEMATDPMIRDECATIASEFAAAESDGLKHD